MRRLRVAVAGLAAGAIVLSSLAGARPAAASEYAGVDWEFGPAATSGAGPWKIAVDHDDRTVVLGAGHLQRFGPTGAPDDTFGTIDIPAALSSSAVQVLDDGTTSVLVRQYSSASILRFDATGAPLASFGDDGVLSLPTTASGYDIAQAADGSVYVEVAASSFWVAVARYGSGGQLDTTYGTDGIASLSCCGGAPLSLGVSQMVANDDGTLDVVVTHENGGAVVRADSAGDLVESVALPVSATDRPQHLVSLPDGSLIVVGFDSSQPYSANGTLRRVTPGWTLDPAFGGTGLVSFQSSGWRDPIHQAGRVVLVIGDTSNTELIGIDAAGIDTSFGTNGRVAMAAPSSIYAISYQVRTIQTIGLSDGRILTIGNASWMSVNQFEMPRRTTVTERDADGTVTAATDSSASWIGDLAPRSDGTASVVLSATAPLYTSVPNSAFVGRWIPTDSDAAMGPVQNLAAVVDGTTATLTWDRPAEIRGLRVDGYKGRLVRPSTGAVVSSWTSLASPKVVPSLVAGQAYRVEVRAVGPQGDGPLTSPPLIVIPHFASVDAFADQLAGDFGLPTPTSSDVATLNAALDGGTIEPEFAVRQVADGTPWASQLDPVVRLYSAYFGRLPDPSGLRYWMAKRASGTTIARISSTFAGSGEFKRKYGSLSDRAFVELVYQNVLGRAGDPAGITYWTGKVSSRATSRGQVMASFSESSEHVRRLGRLTQTVGLYWGMLRRVPTPAEVQNWTGPTPAGDEAALARTLLTSTEYLARID